MGSEINASIIKKLVGPLPTVLGFTSISDSSNPGFVFIFLSRPLDRNFKQIEFHRKVIYIYRRLYWYDKNAIFYD